MGPRGALQGRTFAEVFTVLSTTASSESIDFPRAPCCQTRAATANEQPGAVVSVHDSAPLKTLNKNQAASQLHPFRGLTMETSGMGERPPNQAKAPEVRNNRKTVSSRPKTLFCFY